MMADVGARADWVFVKNPKLFNERFDPDGEQVFEFPIWDASEVRRRALEELPASEIALPKLSQKEAAYLVENNATALAAGRDHRLFVLQQAGFRTVWRRIEGQIRRARPSPASARARPQRSST